MKSLIVTLLVVASSTVFASTANAKVCIYDLVDSRGNVHDSIRAVHASRAQACLQAKEDCRLYRSPIDPTTNGLKCVKRDKKSTVIRLDY